MNVFVQLNLGLGNDLGPNFNLTADAGSVTPSTATKAELLVGKFVDVNASATQITVTSTGTCTNSLVLNITGQTISVRLAYPDKVQETCGTCGTRRTWRSSGLLAACF